MLVFVAIVSMSQVTRVQADDNECARWARMAGKELRVADSIHMHLLGCDDGPWKSMHYHRMPYGDGCVLKARAITRSDPEWFVYRPWTVARMVVIAMPWCDVYEDGSYEDNRSH